MSSWEPGGDASLGVAGSSPLLRGSKAGPRATCQTMKTAPTLSAGEDKEDGAGRVLSHRAPSEAGFKVTTRLIFSW